MLPSTGYLYDRHGCNHRGVSPVIATALLVALVVILATISGSLVIGALDGMHQDGPLVSFQTSQNGAAVVVTHTGGETLDGENLYIVSESGVSLGNYAGDDGQACDAAISTVTVGTECRISDPPTGELSVVWNSRGRPRVLFQFMVLADGPAPTPVLNKDETIVYQGLNAIAGDGSDRSSIDVSGVEALGPPRADLTGDGSNDLPYVKDGNLKLTDSAGNTNTLVSDGAPSNPDTTKTLMAVGQWQGSDTAVFYVNKNHDTIYRVDGSGSTTAVTTPSNGANAIMGTGDIDGDGSSELLFADGSQQIRYVESDGTTAKLDGGGVGSNNGIGVGQPPDFDDDGVVRPVIVDGSNNVKIVGEAESDITYPSTNAKKAPVTAADVDGDNTLEIVYVGSSDYIKYIDDPLGSSTVEYLTDDSGNKILGDGKIGVVS